MNKGLHPELSKRLQLNDEGWKVGMNPVTVETKSGSVYQVAMDGRIGGGVHHREGRLGGAAYRFGGPIRDQQIVVGLSIEFYGEKKTWLTSPVVKINWRH